MTSLPREVNSVYVPPVKCQGIKTKLVPFILASIVWDGTGRWIEPFAGSGVVTFNLAPRRAVIADVNPHIIRLYRAIYDGEITAGDVRAHLEQEGAKLEETGPGADESYYYRVRDRFNEEGDPLDFLFLNRSCFNGMMRFNSDGQFNVPFCRKPERFRKAYVTRIVNQVADLRELMAGKDWTFVCRDWREVFEECDPEDFVYLDPPYIGRHTGYFNTEWTEQEAAELAEAARDLECGVAASMWKENQYRVNEHLQEAWGWAVERTEQHFYHLGATEDLRNEMEEALLVTPGFEAQLEEGEARAGRQEELGL